MRSRENVLVRVSHPSGAIIPFGDRDGLEPAANINRDRLCSACHERELQPRGPMTNVRVPNAEFTGCQSASDSTSTRGAEDDLSVYEPT